MVVILILTPIVLMVVGIPCLSLVSYPCVTWSDVKDRNPSWSPGFGVAGRKSWVTWCQGRLKRLTSKATKVGGLCPKPVASLLFLVSKIIHLQIFEGKLRGEKFEKTSLEAVNSLPSKYLIHREKSQGKSVGVCHSFNLCQFFQS